jgi:hypothetical protein
MGKKFIVKTSLDFHAVINYWNKSLYPYVQKNLDFKPFILVVEEYKEKKSYAQLRGFFRLCNLLVPYFKEWTGEIWNKDKVKEFMKIRAGYTISYKGVQVTRSLADATKEELTHLIQEVQKFGAENDIKDCYLTGEEEQSIIDYYDN